MDVLIIIFTVFRCAIFEFMELLCFLSQMRAGWTWTTGDNQVLIALIVIYFSFRLLFVACTSIPLKIRTPVQRIATIVFTSIEGGSCCLFLFIVALPLVSQKPWLLIVLNAYMLLTSIFAFVRARNKTD